MKIGRERRGVAWREITMAAALALLAGEAAAQGAKPLKKCAADAAISGSQIQQARKIMGPKRKLGLVTPRETGGGESNDAQVIRNAGQRDPEHIKVLDWVHYSAGHASWFQPDGLHLTFAGAKAFARRTPLAATASRVGVVRCGFP